MHEKSKVIVILTHFSNDGSLSTSFVHSHAIALAKEGHNVIEICVNSYFPFIANKKNILPKNSIIHDNGVKIIYRKRLGFGSFLNNFKLNFNGFSYYLVAHKEIRKILKNQKIDLLDAHMFQIEGYAAYKLKKKYDVNTFITCHGSSFNKAFETERGKLKIKKIARIIDKYICVSNKIKNQIESLGINNAEVIYNGIELHPKKKTVKENNIVTVASLVKLKNIDVVINSYKKVKEYFPNVKLNIIGSGVLEQELKDLAGADKDISFLGQLSNETVYEYLEKNLIFLLPSSPEGFGIVYVEAMYNGCITIGTKGEGIDGFINSKNGFLVNVDVAEITSVICKILQDPKKYEKLQDNAIKSAMGLSWSENARKYIELLGGKNV